MTKPITAPFLNYEMIRAATDSFLKKYHPSFELPIPIERIAENDFNICISPINNLKSAFGVDAWLSNNFQEIYVDNDLYEKYDNRYNFTIAHEIGHVVLHKEIFSELGFRNTDEWVAVMRDGLDPNEYGWIESHADNFAGLVLVPGGLLQREFDKAVDMVTSVGYHDTGSMMFGKYVSNHLQKIFKVSTSVINIRLRLDRIIEL